MIGGVTRNMLRRLPGVPNLHVNRPLESRLIWWVTRVPVQTLGKPEIIIIYSFPWKNKSKNSKISRTDSEATSGHSEVTSGHPNATLEHFGSAEFTR